MMRPRVLRPAPLPDNVGHIGIDIDLDCSRHQGAPSLQVSAQSRVAGDALAIHFKGFLGLVFNDLNELRRIVDVMKQPHPHLPKRLVEGNSRLDKREELVEVRGRCSDFEV